MNYYRVYSLVPTTKDEKKKKYSYSRADAESERKIKAIN